MFLLHFMTNSVSLLPSTKIEFRIFSLNSLDEELAFSSGIKYHHSKSLKLWD